MLRNRPYRYRQTGRSALATSEQSVSKDGVVGCVNSRCQRRQTVPLTGVAVVNLWIVKLTRLPFLISSMQAYSALATLDLMFVQSMQFLCRSYENSGKQQQNSEPTCCNSGHRLGGDPSNPAEFTTSSADNLRHKQQKQRELPPAARHIEPDRDGPRRGAQLVFGADH